MTLGRIFTEAQTTHAKIAHEISGGQGAININVLWEMGGAQAVLEGVLEKTRGLVTGVTCGAGMPYKLAEIAARFNVNYLPIISSARAFRALWKRSYHKVAELMVRGIRPASETLPHHLLSDREYQVFNMLVRGRGLTEIGAELSLSVKTISTHKTHILQKMNLANTSDLIRYAIAHGLADPADY